MACTVTATFDGDQKGFSDWVNLSSDLSWERISHKEMAGGEGFQHEGTVNA